MEEENEKMTEDDKRFIVGGKKKKGQEGEEKRDWDNQVVDVFGVLVRMFSELGGSKARRKSLAASIAPIATVMGETPNKPREVCIVEPCSFKIPTMPGVHEDNEPLQLSCFQAKDFDALEWKKKRKLGTDEVQKKLSEFKTEGVFNKTLKKERIKAVAVKFVNSSIPDSYLGAFGLLLRAGVSANSAALVMNQVWLD